MSAWILAGILAIIPSLTQADATQTYRFMMEEEPRHLHTVLSGDVYVNAVIRLVHAGLLRFDQDGHLHPEIAEHWEVSQSGTEILLHLREDARFHNGSPVLADDVVATLTYALNPALPQAKAKRLFMIKGAEAYYQKDTDHVAGLEATGERTIKITLSKPNRFFIHRLAGSVVFNILPADEIALMLQNGNPPAEDETPITLGAGAFQIEKWNRGESIQLVKSPYYHDADNIKIPRIEILFKGHPMFKDSTEEQAFLDGQLDHIRVNENMLALNQRLAADDNPFQVLQSFAPNYYYYAMASALPPLDDLRVRQALNYLYDNESVVGDGPESGYQPLYGLLMPNMPGYRNTLYYRPDPEKARELLAEAGYTDLSTFPELVIGSIENDYEKDRAQKNMQQQLEAFGIRTRLVSYPDWNSYRDALFSKKMHIYPGYYNYAYPTVETILINQFHSAGRYNKYVGFQDKALDAAIDNIIKQKDSVAQTNAILKAEEKLMELSPIMPRFSLMWKVAFSQRVENAKPGWFHGFHGMPIKSISLKEAPHKP